MLRRVMKRPSNQEGNTGEEMLVILGVGLCFVVAFCGAFGSKLIAEWADLGTATGSLAQDFRMEEIEIGHPNHTLSESTVVRAQRTATGIIAFWAESSFADDQDNCDSSTTCGVQICVPPVPETPVP